MEQIRISMIAAIGRRREIGKGNQLLWHIPDDLKRFRSLTNGHPCIMGRKTFESIVAIVGKPLPNRTNIVITRDTSYKGPSFAEDIAAPIIVSSIEDAIQLGKRKSGGEEVFIIGGGEIYALGISYADKLYLTLIDDEKEGDSFFPEYEHIFKKKVYEEGREFEGTKYTWVDLGR